MMQICDSCNQKNSLFSAMTRFIGAVNNMDQTVMVPSLLRDVPLDDAAGGEVKSPARAAGAGNAVHPVPAAYFRTGDMYGYYVLLKSIRNDIEWGVLQGDERRKDPARLEPDGEDLEQLFRFHLNGLHVVLGELTRKANTLTNRYKQEIGIGGCGL
ncbi:hypothetical protein Q7C36_021162 [Tachysurus vachellii]|uniref:Mid1-interacting protein 1 n=1 Tax=Tachysurus vachellii TaxID=175792 RepID=A0AA88J0S6_TACVA|nr:mid1-interacting protein 1-B [Tachysurus fulvidraco]XP_060715433.1 mid1-interacting protein 1-B [Tachysurus vachellii]KAK2819516.1 hypothetical protein Q7C36_021162 [Tachysurus vachellii]